jgi:hypothetical protein
MYAASSSEAWYWRTETSTVWSIQHMSGFYEFNCKLVFKLNFEITQRYGQCKYKQLQIYRHTTNYMFHTLPVQMKIKLKTRIHKKGPGTHWIGFCLGPSHLLDVL